MSAPSAATGSHPSLSTYLTLATVPLIWGTHFVALKVVYEDYTIFGMLSMRYMLMIAVLLGAVWFFERDMRFALRDLPYLAIFSLFMVAIYQILFALAIRWATAAESALLISTAPIFSAITAAALGWERISRRLAAGIALGFLGIFAVIYGGQAATAIPEHATHVKGCLVMLVAAVMWAWYAVLARPLLAKYSPLKVTAYCQTLGGLAIIPIGLREAFTVTPQVVAELGASELFSHPFWVLFGLVYYAWFSGAYAFTVWYRGVRALGSARTMLFQFCVPVVGLVAAIAIRGEYPTFLQWIGAAATLCGVVFAARRPASTPPASETDTTDEREVLDAADAAS